MKNTLTVIVLSFLTFLTGLAQTNNFVANNSNVKEKTKSIREMELPEFIGGQEAMATFIEEEITYPELAFRQGVEGVVLVNFRVSVTGKIIKPYIAQSVHPDLDQEALKLVSEMPKWSPAKQNGVPKEVVYQLPIRFELKN